MVKVKATDATWSQFFPITITEFQGTLSEMISTIESKEFASHWRVKNKKETKKSTYMEDNSFNNPTIIC